ncbi:hypothetical protein K501DRAFT_196550, partial [Backusella circina FSU 941]
PESIKEALTVCPCCSGKFYKPTTLPCGNTVCVTCASNNVCQLCNQTHTTKSQVNHTFLSLQAIVTTATPTTTLDTLRSAFTLYTECSICYTRFTQPTTTPCGHIFCRNCLTRSLDHQRNCPICRYSIDSCPPPTHILSTILIELFGNDDESQDALELDTEDENHVPLLIGSLALPHVNCVLHIFEPRYRLMLRRIMSSKRRRFAMCLSKRRKNEDDAPFYEYGTMLEMNHIQTLPDGRSIVVAVGSHRFKVLHFKLTDGYHMADIERVDDVGREQENQLEQQQILKAISMRARQHQQPQQNVPSVNTPTARPPYPMPLSLSMKRSTPSPMAMIGQRKSWAQRAHPQTQSNVAKSPWLQNHFKGLSAARDKKEVCPQTSASAPTTNTLPTTTIKSREEQTTEELIDDLVRFVQKLLDLRKQQNGMGNWLSAIGEPPVLFGPERDRFVLIWWTINMFPLNEEEKVSLLQFRTLRERVMACMSWTDKMRDQWSFFLK